MHSSKSSVGSNEEFAEFLRSSWIRRLHLKTPTSSISPPIAVNPPPSNASLICNQTAIDESPTPSSNVNAPTTPLPQQDNPSTKLDSIKCSFPGFGPFQLRNRAIDPDKVTVLGEDDDHVNSKKMTSFPERGLVNPLSPFFRHWPDSNKNQGLRENTAIEEEQNKFAKYGTTSPNTSSIIGHPMCAPSLEALVGRDEPCLAITRVASDSKYCLRIGGGINCDNGAASRILRDHQRDVVLSHLERNVSVNPNETGKASFWDMNRFRKTEVLSSMLHPCGSNTKRKTPNSFDEFACVKFRKLGHEE